MIFHPGRVPRFINQSIMISTLKTKSLLPSPAYRQAGFTKGSPAFGGIWQRGATCLREAPPCGAKAGGRFPEAYVFFIMDSLVSSSRSYLLINLEVVVIFLKPA